MSKRLIFCLLLLLPALVLLFSWTVLSPLLVWSLFFFSSLCIFVSFSLLIAPTHGHVLQIQASNTFTIKATTPDGLPVIPRTLAEVYALGEKRFEPFSAAVIMGMGEGHRFLRHSGQSGDQGVDAVLLNLFSQEVIVQSKLYAKEDHVGSPALRDFLGCLSYHHAVYGYFVTTSTFSPAAQQVINSSDGRIRPIDGNRLERLLQRRNREIALAWQDIQG
jgi:hypothetical protein